MKMLTARYPLAFPVSIFGPNRHRDKISDKNLSGRFFAKKLTL